MSAAVSIIDALTAPPFATLNQVLDTGGPYGPGDYTLTTFTTGGAFLLPAGTYSISDTFGVIVQASTPPPAHAGFKFGWNDATVTASGDRYEDRICQVVLLHTLPISGAKIIYELVDVFLLEQVIYTPVMVGTALTLGLHVDPNVAVDLFYLCVL